MGLEEGEYEGMDWIHLAQDMDQGRAPVNTVMKLQVPRKPGDFHISSASDYCSRTRWPGVT
jgi:hypothetical protein